MKEDDGTANYGKNRGDQRGVNVVFLGCQFVGDFQIRDKWKEETGLGGWKGECCSGSNRGVAEGSGRQRE